MGKNFMQSSMNKGKNSSQNSVVRQYEVFHTAIET